MAEPDAPDGVAKAAVNQLQPAPGWPIRVEAERAEVDGGSFHA